MGYGGGKFRPKIKYRLILRDCDWSPFRPLKKTCFKHITREGNLGFPFYIEIQQLYWIWRNLWKSQILPSGCITIPPQGKLGGCRKMRGKSRSSINRRFEQPWGNNDKCINVTLVCFLILNIEVLTEDKSQYYMYQDLSRIVYAST